ncbi:hypothetical protein E7T06_07415 [Deinococcus sp. Arct2-2]|uniref:hypothetical protein n=1 Tax=Deinococcus sp. Arct2-2 TaxID=2568653 RepID=UPI0010A313F8|nr:hypothetical protein [Deinococcus sp. Arct2-2]THF70524.1 hypothetical protein E7T06_07415 [Deinococcus sp. Arct2-2]
MHRLLLPLLSLLLASAIALPAPAPTYCRTIVIKDSVVLVAYKPVIRLAPDCPPDAQARVRKSSTLNTRRNGAPYQPIRPLIGAWIVTPYGSTIPANELWTLLTWRWEWWDGTRWQASEVF